MTKYSRSQWWISFRVVGFVVLLAAVFAGGVLLKSFYPSSLGMEPQAQNHSNHKDPGKATSATQMWTCSMHPQIRQPNPGNCPICGMKLVPVASAGGGGLRQITLDPEAVKLMQLKTSEVERRFVTATVRMVGKVDYDETKVKRITAWVGGRLEELYVNFTGVPVKEGDHMVLIYSPELYQGQTELIQAIKFKKVGGTVTDGIDLIVDPIV
jgi:Cu(I)/Ag(I) efflux system membrane fusion protein